MSERLTVSLEDGIPDKLRTLAGGERKVGAYLSDVVAWLWEYRESLQARPLSGMALVYNEWIAATPEEQQEALEVEGELFWRRQFREQQQRLAQLEAQINQLGASVEALQVSVEDRIEVRDAAGAQLPE